MHSEDSAPRLGLLSSKDEHDEGCCKPHPQRRGRLVLWVSVIVIAAVALVLTTVGITLVVVRRLDASSNQDVSTQDALPDAPSAGTTVDNKTYDLAKPSDRAELLDKITSASHQSPSPASTQGDVEAKQLVHQFKVDPSNLMRYTSGQRRRPTDPATPEEVGAALALLFGEQGVVHSLSEADELAARPHGWAAVNAQLPPEFRIFPESIKQVNRINGCEGSKNRSMAAEWGPYVGGPGTNSQTRCVARDDAEQVFWAEVRRRDGDIGATHEWLRTQAGVRGALSWSSVGSTTTFVDKAAAIAFDDDLDANREPNISSFAKLVALKVRTNPVR